MLLSRHEQALLILLLEQHQLHLIVLEGVIAVAVAGGGGGPRVLHRHSRAAVGGGIELSVGAVHARLAHGTALRSAGAHVGRETLVTTVRNLFTDSLHRRLHLSLHGLLVNLDSVSLHMRRLLREVLDDVGGELPRIYSCGAHHMADPFICSGGRGRKMIR